MIIDTHCHYNLEPLDNGQDSWKHHWQQAQENGITHSVVVGTGLATSHRAVEIATSEPHLLAAVGIHPSEYQEMLNENDTVDTTKLISEHIQELEKLTSSTKVAAIGESGLDYFRLPEDLKQRQLIIETQRQAFKSHLNLALKTELPIIIHVRDRSIPTERVDGNAYWDVIFILEGTLEKHGSLPPFILHCISGPLTYLETALKLGAYIGVAGNVTYKNADHIRSLVTLTPLSKLVLETDAPYLPPHPHRGQACEPWMVRLTAEFLENELGISRDVLSRNAQQIFLGLN